MKKILILLGFVIFVFAGIAWFGNKKEQNYSHLPIRVFRMSGEVPLGATKIFADTIRCGTGNSMSIDLSVAGFQTIPRVQVTPIRNTANPLLVPNVSIKSVSTTTLVINVTEVSATTVLGIPVIGTIQFTATPSDILLN